MIKRLMYRILERDMRKKLAEKHGGQFIHDVMTTFGLETKEYDPEKEWYNTFKK